MKYINRMHKGLFAIAGACLLSGCSDYLETNSESQYNKETIFESVVFTQTELMSVYSLVADAQMYGQRISTNYCTNNDIEYVGADDKSYNQEGNRGCSNYFASSNTSVLKWDNIYKMIERANLTIEGIRESSLISSNKRMKQMLGEALTLRALGYYELIKHWGDVPFKSQSTQPDLSNSNLPRTDRDIIYNSIIEDLQEAAEYLPWMGEESVYSAERVTQGFARGLLARIALSAGGYSLRDKPGYPMERPDNYLDYYKIANDECKTIVDKGVHSLNTSYRGIWENVNALELETSFKENLFEVAFGLGQTGEMGYSIGVRFYKNNKYGYGNNTNTVNTSAYYFYSFDKDDARRDATISYANYSNGNGDLKEVFQSNPLSFTLAKWDQRMMSDAWRASNLAANGKMGYGINWVVMRYSDVLLMLAETENELNGAPTADAQKALKEVRSRVFDKDEYTVKVENYVASKSSKEDFFQAIVNERAWEFGGEGLRKFDLVRWNLLQEKIQEQRQTIIDMINGMPVKIADNDYAALPQNLYYRYEGFVKADKADTQNGGESAKSQIVLENIDREDINWYSDRTDLEGLSTAELEDEGYTRVAWFAGLKDETKTQYIERVTLFSSGLEKTTNGVCDNRYIYPLYNTAISDSQGLLKQGYGY